MKKLLTVFVVFTFLAVLVGCGMTTAPTTSSGTTTTTSSGTNTTTTTSQTTSTSLANIESDTGLDPNAVGIVDIVLWSGSGATLRDIGNQTLTPDQLLAQNEAAAYAVAKAFNEIYPNIVINGYFKSGDPGGAWNQVLETYRDDEGRFPSVWASVDLAGDVSRGIVADISRFEADPLYQILNPGVMSMMNYYGFQAGLPQYILPWGVYVNKSLADANGIEVPGYDWHIDDYTEFTSNYSDDPENQYYGAMDTPIHFLETGTTTMWASLAAYTGGTTFVNMNSTQVRSMIGYIAEWAGSTFWSRYDEEIALIPDGTGPAATLIANIGWWQYHMFRQGKLLTLEGDPWMMGDCAETNPNWWAVCNITDWDIYPRPATDFQPTTIGLVLDPMAVYNFCLDDGDLSCTPEEELKIQIAYTFAMFWCADSRSFEARANQLFYDAGSDGYSSALNDSMPVVTGPMFEDQMAYWYTPSKHQRFNQKIDGDWLMPGFQEVLRIYEEGAFWDVSDKSFPWYYTFEGTRNLINYEWSNYWNVDNVGTTRTAPDYESTVLSLLPTWNETINARWFQAFERVKNGLMTYYGYSPNDFE
jgi:hypothetical protein